MNEDLRIRRCEQYGSFLYCPKRDTLCFGRYTDEECKYESCILDDPEYQKLQKIIDQNRKRRNARAEKKEAVAFVPPNRPKKQKAEVFDNQNDWEQIHALEDKAAELYRKNKPKIADGLLAKAMHMRRRLAEGGEQ